MQKVAIQGISGSFHELAAKQFFGEQIETVDCLSFKDLFESLQNGESDYAIMAIENTIAGTILSNYNLLKDYHFKIIGETYIHIQMNLVVLPNTKIEDIKVIKSHPIALQQCNEFLWGLKGVEIKESEDTAASAKEIKENKLIHNAAIVNDASAELYELKILEKRIETNKQNFTRFLALSKMPKPKEENDKASICLILGHFAGSLADTMLIFKENNINLTHIQSVPLVGKPYEYYFHIDLTWNHVEDYHRAMHQLLRTVSNVSVLGEYKKGKLHF